MRRNGHRSPGLPWKPRSGACRSHWHSLLDTKHFDPMSKGAALSPNRFSINSPILAGKTLIVYVELPTAREIEVVRAGEVVHLSKPADRLLLDSGKVRSVDRLSFSRLKSLAVNPNSTVGPPLVSTSDAAKLNKLNGVYVPTPALVLQTLVRKTPLPTKSNPIEGVRGAMTYTMKVDPSGEVVSVQMRGMRGPESDRIATLLKDWKFSPFQSGPEAVSAIFPLTFFVDGAGNDLGPLEFRTPGREPATGTSTAAENCWGGRASAPRSGR